MFIGILNDKEVNGIGFPLVTTGTGNENIENSHGTNICKKITESKMIINKNEGPIGGKIIFAHINGEYQTKTQNSDNWELILKSSSSSMIVSGVRWTLDLWSKFLYS